MRQNREETRTPLKKKKRDSIFQKSSVKMAEGKSSISNENKTVSLETGNPEGYSQLIAGSFMEMLDQDPVETAPHQPSLPGLLFGQDGEQQELGGTLPGPIVSPSQLLMCRKRKQESSFEQVDSKLQEEKKQEKEVGEEQCQVPTRGSQKITPVVAPLMDTGSVLVASDDLSDVQQVQLQPKSHAQVLQKSCKTPDEQKEQVAGDLVGEAPHKLFNCDKEEKEDEELLEDFFEEKAEMEDYDPRQRFVVRFRYKGLDPHKLTERYLIETIILGALQVPKPDVLAVIRLQGLRETDLCLISEGAYHRVWGRVRATLRRGCELLDDYDLIPQFREQDRVVTITFRAMNVLEKDVGIWLEQHCKVLMPPRKQLHERRGLYKAIIALHRDNRRNFKHLPKYVFLGNDRGVIHYSGQPPACYQCGRYGGISQNCNTPLCEACGKHGHGSWVRDGERKSGCNGSLESGKI